MPSEQRLHPATLLFELAMHVKRFAVPAVLVIFGASQSSGGPGGMFARIPSGWESWLLVMLVPAAIFSIARYLSFRLRYDDDGLVIRTGLIFRNERHVPFARIQNVDAVQNVFHRFFGVVEIRVETGGGKEEEARMSVLPHAAFEDMRQRVFAGQALQGGGNLGLPEDSGADPALSAEARSAKVDDTLVHLSLRETLLCGLLDNKGMVLVGAATGVMWETGLGNAVMGPLFSGSESIGRGFFRALIRAIFDGGELPWLRIGLGLAAFTLFLLVVRLLSMAWAFVRLYDFRLIRVGEDLRTEYGLLTKVTATVPIRRVQTITVRAGPLHRWLHRATVRVETAGGAGDKSGAHMREWLAPLIHESALPTLLQRVLPGFDLASLAWQPLHPRAFARAVKPGVIITSIITIGSSFAIGWGAIGVLILLLPWSILSTRQHIAHIGWAESDEVVAMKTGWLWQRLTIARVNKIQAIAMRQSPFDRRAAMASVRVDTAGAGEMSRIDIPYLDGVVARELHDRLSAHAANTAFRW